MKRILFTFLFLGFVSSVYSFQVPLDRRGKQAQSIYDAGVLTFTTSMTVTDGVVPRIVKGSTIAVFGIITSTLGTGSAISHVFVELRATDTANRTSELLVPPLAISSTTRNTFHIFDPPILAVSGVSIFVNTPTARVTLLYTHVATNNAGTFSIPLDSQQGNSISNRHFYGVQVSSESMFGDAANNRVGAESLDYNSDEMLVSTGSRYLITGFHPSTGALGNYVTIRDDFATGNINNLLVVPIFYNTVYENNNGAIGGRPFTFPFPIVAENGVTVQTNTNDDRFRLFIKDLRSLRYK